MTAPRWTRPLHVRAALVTVPLLLALGAAVVLLMRHHSGSAALEAAQRMNLDLARYVVEHQPGSLLDGQGRADPLRMKELARHVMSINPAVEVYLLDADARVIGHALDAAGTDPVGARVDMLPMQRLLRTAADPEPRLPVLGTDPLDPARRAIFTVAPVQAAGGKMGYLYIVLDGRGARRVAANLANSDTLRAMAAAAALATLLAAAVLVLAWAALTRPLRQLAAEVQSFRKDEPTAADRVEGDEIASLRGALEAMRERIAGQFDALAAADRQRRELVSNISHDLRTPLANIRGYVETVLVQGDELDPAARRVHLRTALRHVDLLGRRVADLFELSKLDAGRVELVAEEFCLAELLQDVVQNWQLAAERRGVVLRLAASSRAPWRVRADIALIERVLQNLIDNALRHTQPGGQVELALEEQGAFVGVSVSDTGRGIESHHLPHIFERYWRASDPDDGNPATSAGLGLAIVKRILELHGAAVQVQSEPKRGTRFEFQLPQAG